MFCETTATTAQTTSRVDTTLRLVVVILALVGLTMTTLAARADTFDVTSLADTGAANELRWALQ